MSYLSSALLMLAALGYGLALLMLVRSDKVAARFGTKHIELVVFAWMCQMLGLGLLLFAHSPVRFGFAQALCATLWVALAVLLYESRSMDVRSLLRALLPVAALTCVLPLLFAGQSLPASASRPEFVLHLVLGTAAYGVLLIAALHALLMVSAQRALQSGGRETDEGLAQVGPLFLIGELPPLMSLEKILFSLIGLGFILLSLTLLSGTVFSGEVFGQPFRFDHKTIFTFLAWLVFAVLLIGRKLRGWRGRTALRFTLVGFGLLLLGYVGSRFVLEVLLGR